MSSDHGVILHVDDESDARASLSTALQLAGFDEHAAGTPDEALQVANALRGTVDVLIVDYHLRAEITGTELAETIARHFGHSLPTIILTGDPANAEIPLLSNAPVWLIRKPLDPDLLMATLPALVQFNRAVRRLESEGARRGTWSSGAKRAGA